MARPSQVSDLRSKSEENSFSVWFDHATITSVDNLGWWITAAIVVFVLPGLILLRKHAEIEAQVKLPGAQVRLRAKDSRARRASVDAKHVRSEKGNLTIEAEASDQAHVALDDAHIRCCAVTTSERFDC